MKFLFITFFFIISYSSFCQKENYEKVKTEFKNTHNLYFSKQKTDSIFYVKLVPKNPIACMVIFPAGGEQVENLIQQIDIQNLAFQKNIMTIIPSINWGTRDRIIEVKILNSIFKGIINEYKIPKDKFILGGLSNGGMISLTYTELSAKDSTKTIVKPAAVFAVDPPIDDAHFYKYCEREILRNYSEAGKNEAIWIKNIFDTEYGGSPDSIPEVYIKRSIYSYGAKNGGNAEYLIDTPLRLYTDLDLEYLLKEKHRDLYDWNGTDIIAMTNELKNLGHEDIEVILSTEKGLQSNGTRKPHSWAILDSNSLIPWLLTQIKN